MHPWHCLVCDHGGLKNLAISTGAFVLESVSRDPKPLRAVPPRVSRLIELGRARRESVGLPYLDYDYWNGDAGETRDLAGLVTFNDSR